MTLRVQERAGPAPRGFTLFEMVVVLGIIAVVSAIAIPRYSRSLEQYRAEAAVRRIAADLEFAASRARLISDEIEVAFEDNDDKNWYVIKDYDDPEHPGNEYTVYLWKEPYGAWMFDAPGDIKFDLYGMPNKDATIQVRSGSATTGVVRTVVVDKNSGEITVP